MRKLIFPLFLFTYAFGQTADQSIIHKQIIEKRTEIINDFRRLLAIPNVAAESEKLNSNANWLADYMKSIGIKNIKLLHSKKGEAPPVVYGESIVANASSTIIFYAHYDGQPVDTSKWEKGLKPFEPVLLDASLHNGGKIIDWPKNSNEFDDQWRIYGRGSSDDKAGVMAILQAFKALQIAGQKPNVNIKFFFEGEEEAGSPHLEEILENNKSILNADLWLICDGPIHQSGKKQIVYGVRGDTHLELTVFGANRPLHSGHYGNWAPNPAMQLSHLLASMKDENGIVTIKGFYDDVKTLSEAERSALKKIPNVEDRLKAELGFIRSERNDGLASSLNFPSLNVNGLQSAGVGKLSANIIPTKAIASIDLRLVVGNDWKRQQQKVIDHIELQGFYVTDHEPNDDERKKYPKICMVKKSDGYNAQKTSMDHPLAKKIAQAIKVFTNEDPILTPTLGGSLPLYVFEKVLNTHPITVPIANHDNNQHAENENIRLKNFWDGIEMFANIMMLGK